MKRILLTILAVFYLGLSSGATMHFHYCMGELVSWGLEKQSNKICDFCGMPIKDTKKKSCCEDLTQQVKVEKSQKAGQTIYKFETLSTAILVPEFYVNYKLAIPVKTTREALGNAPPKGQEIPVYLKNCTYRI